MSDQIPEQKRSLITARLTEIESEHSVKILFAVESGSRAWGFPSQDSDFDIRFIYAHTQDWYLSINEGRDVIEDPIIEDIDLVGWDLRKALRLMAKSNSTLSEWLRSPITYSENPSFRKELLQLDEKLFSSKPVLYSYLSMGKSNYKEYFKGEKVKIKKYFYVLRPLLCCKWILKHASTPPMEFSSLVEDLVADPILNSKIEQLIERKLAGIEAGLESRISEIDNYIEAEIELIESEARKLEVADTPRNAILDDFFRNSLKVF